MLALDGHIEKVAVSSLFCWIIVRRAVQVHIAFLHLYHPNVLLLRVAGKIVFHHAGINTLPASDAASDVQGIGILDAVEWWVGPVDRLVAETLAPGVRRLVAPGR